MGRGQLQAVHQRQWGKDAYVRPYAFTSRTTKLNRNDMEKDAFDYGSLPYETWKEFAATVGAYERQLKFAAAKFRGCTNTEAARQSGFGVGSETSTRSEGYRVARSNKVNQLLALAAAEAGGGYDGTLSKQEARSILTAMATRVRPTGADQID